MSTAGGLASFLFSQLLPDLHMTLGKHGTGKHGTGKHDTGKHGTGKHGTGKHGTGKHGATTCSYYLRLCPIATWTWAHHATISYTYSI